MDLKKISIRKRAGMAILLLCMAQAFVRAQQPQPSPMEPLLGKWTVKQVTVEKTTDGVKQTAVYHSAGDVKSYYRCPQGWEIKAENIEFSYPNGRKETCISYMIEETQLTICTTSVQQYQYAINSENLTLTTAYNYVNNMPTGEVQHIGEQWTIILKKQN